MWTDSAALVIPVYSHWREEERKTWDSSIRHTVPNWEPCDLWTVTAQPKSILTARAVPGVHWSYMAGHVGNFLACVRSRRLPASHAEVAHRAHTIAHCANTCLRLGRPVRWDPKAERFVGDDEANHMLARTMRAPWRL